MKTFKLIVASGLVFTLAPALANASEICVTNASGEDYFFAAEASGGPRQIKWLAAGETLCRTSGEDIGGVVSVFFSEEHLEGCSRLVSAAETETLMDYVDFDRCRWSSNDN